jgi:hypothetical protein
MSPRRLAEKTVLLACGYAGACAENATYQREEVRHEKAAA